MRLIDYYNIAATITLSFLVIIYFIKPKLAILQNNTFFNSIKISKTTAKLLFFLIVGLGIFLRFYHLSTLPEGMHQDEVSNAYEAFCLANYGIDRNGYTYPIYPITWGSGGGSPVLIYLYAIMCRFLEPSVFSYRFIFAFLGSLTLILFYLFLQKTEGTKAALLGMGILAVTPWHIIISRWGLDSNTIPFWCMIIFFLFFFGNKTGKTLYYVLTSSFCALILYCYGSATFVMPFFVLFACAYSLWTKRMTWKQLLFSFISFAVIVFPLAIFYFINVFDQPAITTAYFSFPRFTGKHTDSVFISFNRTIFSSLGKNFVHLLSMLTIGAKDELWNYMPGYFTLYHFTFPISFLGLFSSCKKVFRDLKEKVYHPHGLMISMFSAAFLIAMFMNPNINRTIFLYLPMVYFMTIGFMEIGRYSRPLVSVGIVVVCIGALSFTKDYFTKYGNMSNYLFMKGYGDSIVYAESIREDDQMIYSTYENLASPFITALLYSRTSPYDYLETVEFKGLDHEFRVATSFTHYVFGLPEDIEEDKYKEHIIIISNMEIERFKDLGYKMTEFGNFTVLKYRE